MTMIDDDSTLTTAELSEELIFLIATALTDAQRKRATDLFRRFARQVEAEAWRRGRDSVSPVVSPEVAPAEPAAEGAPIVTETLPPDHRVSLIPLVSWQD